ncbi:MAG TPA: hypothetical protein VMK65_13445 [Longimicrobiales bacterium]|nr:hypothetical protein [Longimicrobiales bacterium]
MRVERRCARPWRVLIVFYLLTPAAGWAQERADTARPFVAGGVYDKPYLTTLLGRTSVGGYAEAHAALTRVDGVTEDAGFSAKRFNLFTATRVSDIVRMGAELEFEEGGEEIKLEYAAIDILVHPSFALRGGMILSPLGRFNLSHDSPRNEFTDRPLVATELLGVALSEPGFGFFGVVPFGAGQRVSYEIYGVNGFDEGVLASSSDGTRVPFGRGNFEDNNNSPAAVGRVTWSPSLSLEVGLSGHHGAYNIFQADGLELDERRDVRIGALDWEVEVAKIRLTGEAARVGVDVPPSLQGLFAVRQQGLYTEVVRDFGRGWVSTLPASHFTTGVRLAVVDFDRDVAGDMVRQVTLGLNFRPTADTALKLDVLRGVSRDRFNNPSDHAGVRFSIATYF